MCARITLQHSDLSARANEYILFLKTNNISRKPQVINHKWINAAAGEHERSEKRREKEKKLYIYETIFPSAWYRSAVKQFYHCVYDAFPHKSTQTSKLLLFFSFQTPRLEYYYYYFYHCESDMIDSRRRRVLFFNHFTEKRYAFKRRLEKFE